MVIRDRRAVYAKNDDMTFIVVDEIDDSTGEVLSTAVTGFYFGEPDDEATETFDGKPKAVYSANTVEEEFPEVYGDNEDVVDDEDSHRPGALQTMRQRIIKAGGDIDKEFKDEFHCYCNGYSYDTMSFTTSEIMTMNELDIASGGEYYANGGITDEYDE